jgi:ATP-binding cassette subfamily B protein
LNYALSDINLKINKGEIVGVVGESGAGKSTLLDLILGLTDPTAGEILIDGKSILEFREKFNWQQKIAHVPQNIYLSDATFAENIAFGVPENQIDYDKVIYAARLAHISDFIEAKPKSYLTTIGERGAQISGGQRQRIGIARAFYKTSEVIIFDEATSALDEKTENQVFDSIKSLSTSATVLIVSHKPQTLKNCSKIIELSRGKLMRVDSYSNFFKNV